MPNKDFAQLIYEARLFLLNYLAFGVLRSIHLTYGHYSRQISGAVAMLYNGAMTEAEFVTLFSDIIPQQLRRAWNEGMAENGLDPGDITEEWQLTLDARILSEFDFVDRFAAAIVAARSDPTALQGLLARGDLWANRYNDVANEARLLTADSKEKYVWRMGATEEHCQTCSALNGIVAFAREWEQARFRPQDPPNDLLECGGWRCDCTLESTTARRTPKALDRLLDIAARKGL
jgi:hypothetical protein